jgi:hypothetical protein
MRKPKFILGWFLMTLIFSCSKGSNQATDNNSSLFGKWILVETLADPGDGSGKWTAVDRQNYYYLTLDTDNTIETNCFTGLGGAKKFRVVNDSVINFIYANGQTILYHYLLDNSSLTVAGGCIEACGSKFVRTKRYP